MQDSPINSRSNRFTPAEMKRPGDRRLRFCGCDYLLVYLLFYRNCYKVATLMIAKVSLSHLFKALLVHVLRVLVIGILGDRPQASRTGTDAVRLSLGFPNYLGVNFGRRLSPSTNQRHRVDFGRRLCPPTNQLLTVSVNFGKRLCLPTNQL